jgi:hypothetical protein
MTISCTMVLLRKAIQLAMYVSALALPIIAAAPTDSPRDADIAQTSYLGGDHNVDPETVSQFKQLWNASFNPDEKVRDSPPHLH